jgi:CelD/BcsL family acetyltransferase involved in cellulose biosynthesis/selenocysteine lyase/cysteine desulfurase
MPFTIEIISSPEQVARLCAQWDSLLERSRRHPVFLTPEWMLTWWEVYGEGARMFLIAVRHKDRLVGLLPCYITGPALRKGDPYPRQLRLLGSTAVCSDLLDGLAEPGFEGPVIAAWQSAIRAHQGEWESLEFADLDQEGLLFHAIRREPALWGKALTWTERAGEPCPFIPLPASWEDYLSSLSPKRRREIRHDRRALERVGPVRVRAVTETDQVEGAMAVLMRLHQLRRESLGDQGSFADRAYGRFHLMVSRRMAERGWLRLWFLDINGTPAAARYQFVYRGCVHDYLPGQDPSWYRFSVGLVLLSYCVEYAILNRDQEVNLLRGAETYKLRWAAYSHRQRVLTATQPMSRAWMGLKTSQASSSIRRLVKQVLPAPITQMIQTTLRTASKFRRQRMERKYVPFFPSTSLRNLWGSASSKPQPFPLEETRVHYYYFARNGIWHAIDLLGLTPNDEVLMPAYNNGMEVAPFQHRGIPLRFVRVDRQMVLDLKELEQKITPRTRMVYVIHYLGFAQPIGEIRDLCRKHDLILFEDCALAFGSSANGQPLGSFGDAAIFCLPKFLPVPNGGVLILNNPNLKMPPPTRPPSRYSVGSQLTTKILDHFEAHGGPVAGAIRHMVTRVAQQFVRQAGLRRVDSGVMQFMPDKVDWGIGPVSRRILERVDCDVAYHKRRNNYRALLEMVRMIEGVTPLQPSLPNGVCPLFLPVLVDNNQKVCNALIQRGISAGGFWHWFPPGVPVEEFPDTAFLRTHVLELQIHQDLEIRHLEATAHQLREVMGGLV